LGGGFLPYQIKAKLRQAFPEGGQAPDRFFGQSQAAHFVENQFDLTKLGKL
jgi:hypothetical protein